MRRDQSVPPGSKSGSVAQTMQNEKEREMAMPHAVETEREAVTQAYCSNCCTPFDARRAEVFRSRVYCPDCMTECEECGERIPLSLAESYDGIVYCRSCASQLVTCRNCGEVITGDVISHGSRSYCTSCFENMFTTCDGCGNEFRRERAYYTDSGETYCPECHSESALIHEYGYSPRFKWNHVPGEKRAEATFFGIELEMEARGRTSPEGLAEVVKEHLKDTAYCKKDGSLANGLELVTHPTTARRFRQDRALWMKLLADLRVKGARSHATTTCGLHIHFSRLKWSSEIERLKLRKFFYWCRPYLEKFSRRREYSYCAFERTEPTSDWHTSGRYWALNMNASQETFEVRVFRGSLQYDTIRASLELVEAVGEFCLAHGLASFSARCTPEGRKTPNTGTLWKRFRLWIAKEGRWKYLQERLNKLTLNNDGEDA